MSHVSAEAFITALYRGVLEREPDDAGLSNWLSALQAGVEPEEIVKEIANGPEFSASLFRRISQVRPLPDLRDVLPGRHCTVRGLDGADRLVFQASGTEDFDALERAIDDHGYYDRPGIWPPVIDEDKHVTASIALDRDARSCLEFGCFNGPVLSLLADQGVDVCGVELSNLALVTAFPNVRNRILFGDLLTVDPGRRFDVIFCMGILEHLNPNRLPAYIDRLRELLAPHGLLYVNSPMFGSDARFGEVFPLELPSWQGREFFGDLICDDLGWPVHGHLICATPTWWSNMFAHHGLRRASTIEQGIASRFSGFFANARTRRSYFALQVDDAKRGSPVALPPGSPCPAR